MLESARAAVYLNFLSLFTESEIFAPPSFWDEIEKYVEQRQERQPEQGGSPWLDQVSGTDREYPYSPPSSATDAGREAQ